ncbi:serine hydrolase domain-containing protein [Nitratireductor sp. GZWM139]|uniref:serine hydrolase domain-containing protein n=1 Tax=Nitratireductor sp. GZWM139 TaxID=2950541 RepID=UPI0024BE582D|nr:serine hydrolase domain-containing protein [Nitratireductor sp. GZWM139]MDJ1465390.1 beta-lactamase family protein [Nitratireductor sp. GZWM139]
MAERDWAAAENAALEGLGIWPADGPGGVVLGMERGTIRFVASAGHAGVGGAPLGPDSVFRWASVTKHVFAACLIESGVLPLDMTLGEALPELAAAPASVTVAQALAMQGGLPDPRESLTLLGFGSHTRTEAAPLHHWMAGFDWLNARPGHEVAYSNGGYRLLETALARRDFVFSEMVSDHARRLGIGMRASEYWTDPVAGLVPGHEPASPGWSEGFQGMHLSAAGSLSGSARDLAVWLSDLMARDVFAQIARPLPLGSGEATGYGLGIALTQIGAERVPGHGGAQAGYRAGFLCAPEEGIALVALSNRDDGDATGLAARVWARLRGVPQAQMPKPAGDWAPSGLYVAEEGDLWAEVKKNAIVVRDAEEALFAGDDGRFVSAAPHARMRLAYTDGALSGDLFHQPVRLLPVRGCDEEPELDGRWMSDGAIVTIRGRTLHWGAGPLQTEATLKPLGNGRWLFNAMGRRICLQRLSPDRFILSLARARGVEYRRL